ncbi:GNAT family N-acetyltransferase [Thalassotalea marina]|uniref:N-acetyltransferase n=1 Tax=Thalassotalea marina TaxID=1673741 RepID=A0A919EKP2_9GAMM|nr:GNAT family N-acetyltransferase [Thalassotalea marina]GHF91231.1 N-acetyltransferase [Thalassotalea marina]
MLLTIEKDDLLDGQIIELLKDHLKDMYATSPAESVHALKIDELKQPDIQFWAAKVNHQVVGCIALKYQNKHYAEIKSMRTVPAKRGFGVAQKLLNTVIEHAKENHLQHLKLETGTQDFFLPARTLYFKNGFVETQPFAQYKLDKHSTFMTLALD